LAVGLDRGDTVVKRYLAQKMGMIVADLAALRRQGPEEVKAWFKRSGVRFALPPRASFRHIYFSFDLRHGEAEHDAATALVGSDATAEKLGDAFMFQSFYGDRTPQEVASVFGDGFAEALFQVQPGAWAGPVESGYGWHLVWIDSLVPGRVPAFEEVQQTAGVEWLAEQRKDAQNRFYETVRKRYRVDVPETVTPFPCSAPMSAAPMAYLADGRPDWGSMWTSYCELGLYGGAPHRGEADALTAEVDPQPLNAEMEAVQETIRGIYETTGLEAEPAEAGWIAVTCNSTKMAAWLCATIIMENVEARCARERLLLPASPDFTLQDQIKSVITVVAKTNHYWQAHINGTYSPQIDSMRWQAQ